MLYYILDADTCFRFRYPAWVASKGVTEDKEWPLWAMLLVAFLVLAAVLWIPVVAICRYPLHLQTSIHCQFVLYINVGTIFYCLFLGF